MKTENKMSDNKTINFTFNFNAPVGQNIAHVDKLEAHFDKDMTMQVVDTATLCHKGMRQGEVRFSVEDLARAVEACQAYFWAQSSWAVVYCVCRDHLSMSMSVVDFERMVEALPFTHTPDYQCPKGTVQKALDNNDYMKYPIARWQECGAKKRALQLTEKLVDELD